MPGWCLGLGCTEEWELEVVTGGSWSKNVGGLMWGETAESQCLHGKA